MSKIKLSFSLILAIFLVGILSTAAFAKSAYGPGVAADGSGGFTFSFTKIAEDPATTFTVDVYSQNPTTKNWDVELKAGGYTKTGVDTTKQTVNIPKSDGVVVGTVYKFVLSNAAEVGVKFGVLTDSSNLKLASIADDSKDIAGVPTKLLDVEGSGLPNANHTGANDNKKKPGQNTHGFYQNNTNSCASCHQTHTAAQGEYLLFKDGVYSTCSACHDGTTGAYNSFEVANSDTPNEIAGTFNISTDAAHNGSLHQSDGSLQVSAAPGGNNKPAAGSKFDQEFNCTSCHAAHGSGSVAENNLSLDPLGWGGVPYVANGTPDQQNGKQFTITTFYTEAEAAALPKGDPYILVKRHLDQAAVDANYFYKRANITVPAEGIDIIQLYSWKTANHQTKYMPDYSLLLREKGYPYKADTKFWSDASGTTEITSGMTVVWRDGFAYGTAAATVAKAQIAVGIDVETTNDMATLFDSANTNYIPDSGLQMSNYCTRCHSDYLSITRTDVTGVYAKAHRHQTATDTLTCVRCHFGHGSDAQIMKDANDETFWTLTGPKFDTDAKKLDYLVDVNPSSALKRYTGMSVCYACHGKGEQFLANPNVNHIDPSTDDPIYGRHSVDNSSLAGDWLTDGQPGATRTPIAH